MSILQEYEEIRKRLGEEVYQGIETFLERHPEYLLSDVYYNKKVWNQFDTEYRKMRQNQIDRNTLSFDKYILKRLSSISTTEKEIDMLVRRILKEKNTCKLLISRDPKLVEKEGYTFTANYWCIPQSTTAKYYFCLHLVENFGILTVSDCGLMPVD